MALFTGMSSLLLRKEKDPFIWERETETALVHVRRRAEDGQGDTRSTTKGFTSEELT